MTKNTTGREKKVTGYAIYVADNLGWVTLPASGIKTVLMGRKKDMQKFKRGVVVPVTITYKLPKGKK